MEEKHSLFTISPELPKYVYDLSKLSYGGMFLVGVLQEEYGYAMIGMSLSFLFLFIARYIEEKHA